MPGHRPWTVYDLAYVPPEPSTSVPLPSLIGSEGLPGEARAVRQLLEAVALGHSVPTPARDVPRDWVPVLKELHRARSEGASWADALTRTGLVPPPDPHAHLEGLRAELGELYDRVPPLIAWVNKLAVSTVVRQRLLEQLGQLLV